MGKSSTPSAIRKRMWREENKELYLKNNRESNWRLNGMDVDKANELRDKARSCAICKLPGDNLCVDHCHQTGKVRGMLCCRCNTGIGMFSDNTTYLEEAIIYLENS